MPHKLQINKMRDRGLDGELNPTIRLKGMRLDHLVKLLFPIYIGIFDLELFLKNYLLFCLSCRFILFSLNEFIYFLNG